jgi:hypothetical protein
MSDRDRATPPKVYLDVAAILGELLSDLTLRDITEVAREALDVALGALSFPAPGFSSKTTIFVRDCVVPVDFAPCAETAATEDVFAVPHLNDGSRAPDNPGKLRSFAGCAVLDRESHCIGVFYMMDTKPHRLTATETLDLRAYTHLVSSRIEILRRFGPGGPDPSPREIIHRADQVANVGQSNEAQDLITLAYAAHDIAGMRHRSPDDTAARRRTPR